MFFNNNLIKYLWVLVILSSLAFAQNEQVDEQQNQNQDSAEQSVQESEQPTEEVGLVGAVRMSNVLISDFEDADLWFGEMSIDDGIVQVEKRRGAPKEVREGKPIKSKFILGAKINFFKSGISTASVEPPNPLVIPGITRKLSVWAFGRGYRHILSVVLRDFKGRIFKFPMGDLSFKGWKKLETDIPSDPAWPFFSQIDVSRQTYFQTHGVTFVGFTIDFDPKQALGRAYIYLDDFVAESNVYLYEKELELAKTPEDERLDPIDNW